MARRIEYDHDGRCIVNEGDDEPVPELNCPSCGTTLLLQARYLALIEFLRREHHTYGEAASEDEGNEPRRICDEMEGYLSAWGEGEEDV